MHAIHIYKRNEMVTVRQNPIQRTVWSVRMCVHCTVHNNLSCTTMHRTGLIIFLLTLRTITIAPMMFLVSNTTYLIMQTMLEMTFLLLVTISIVWYVFFLLLTICFFIWWGRAPVSEDVEIFLGVLSCILLTVSLLCESDKLTNKLIDWHLSSTLSSIIVLTFQWKLLFGWDVVERQPINGCLPRVVHENLRIRC